MSFLAPWVFAAGVVAALATVALHLLSTRRPPRAVLPTARFVPESESRAVSRSSRPTDLLLLACRVLALLAIASAFARPVPDAPGPSVRSMVLLDVSSGVAVRDAAVREAIALRGEGGALIVFDTSARVVAGDSVAVSAAVEAGGAPVRVGDGVLGAAFVAGVREARAIARGADSVRMVIVSPLAQEAFDAGTAALRATWPGGITLMRVPGVSDTVRGPRPVLDTPLADDPIAPAIAGLDAARGTHVVRVVRRALTVADSAWVQAAGRFADGDGGRDSGRVLVHWPLVHDEEVRGDGVTAFGLVTATMVAPLARFAVRDESQGAPVVDRSIPTRTIARWRDGSVAATERSLGAGCIRDVGVGIPLSGDLTLRPQFVAFLQVLAEPCGGARGPVVSDSTAQAFAGGDAAVAAPTLAAAGEADGTLAARLLALALVALAAEWFLRRRGAA